MAPQGRRLPAAISNKMRPQLPDDNDLNIIRHGRQRELVEQVRNNFIMRDDRTEAQPDYFVSWPRLLTNDLL